MRRKQQGGVSAVKKKMKKLCRKVKRKVILAALGLLACGLTVFAFKHRRVIRAAIKGKKRLKGRRLKKA